MGIYVDEAQYAPPPRLAHLGSPWCHLTTEPGGDLEALHAFAARIGLKRGWFQQHRLLPHYDLCPSKRVEALAAGALFRPARDQVKAAIAHREQSATDLSLALERNVIDG